MTPDAQVAAGALAEALATYAAWLGRGETDRAALWVDRLRLNEAELARLREAPHAAAPAYVARPVIPAPPQRVAAAASQRLSEPDAGTALRRARESSHLCLFTHIVDEATLPAPGYLRGAPFAVKDLIGVAGMHRTGGSASEPRAPFACDAPSVAALRRHGGVVIGLANLHELAFGASSVNPVFGAVVNPAASGCMPGGSSGGSAAMVAAGIVPFALGTDTGGSIRIPAACCGVVGFKPSYGAVPVEGVIGVGESLDHVGPIGRTVVDCAHAFAALTDLPEFPGLAEQPLQGLRVARLGGHFEQPLDADVRVALDAACERLREDGAGTDTSIIAGVENASAIYFVTVLAEAGCEHAERLRTRAAQLGDDVRVRLEIASLLPATWYVKAQRMRRQLAESMDSVFARADVMLCATLRTPAPRIGATAVEIDGRRYSLHQAMSDLTLPFSLAGLPAISIPWGRSRDGVPIGLQVVGARGQDWKVLQVAHRLEMLAAAAR